MIEKSGTDCEFKQVLVCCGSSEILLHKSDSAVYDGDFEKYVEIPGLVSSIHAVRDFLVIVDVEAVVWLFDSSRTLVCKVEGTECWPSPNSFSISADQFCMFLPAKGLFLSKNIEHGGLKFYDLSGVSLVDAQLLTPSILLGITTD